jgi:hypothetical protein
MRNRLILLVVFVMVLSTACKTEVASRKPDQIKNQPGTNVNTSQQTPIASPSESKTESFKPKNGYVPNEQTAIAIAVAVWTPIYGREQIESEKPFKATLKNGVWTVTGTLPEGYVGGTAVADIAQADGRVLRVIHYQ